MSLAPKQVTLDLRRRVLGTAHGLPGDPRLAVLMRIPPPGAEALQRMRNGPRRPA